ncbi:MAG: Butyryl-CoA dehydrogenase, partial [Pseudonocardiales bacterium]|nr:Butyryl-CoA dehydrogenase [Pseudonocardiales bacterium]
MIDPLLPAHTAAFAEAVRGFASTRLRPGYQAREREGRFDPELIKEMARLGLLGLRAPAELGGEGADAVTTGIAAEEVGRADLSAGYLINNTALATEVLVGAGNPEQQRRFVPEIATGQVVPALCLTEPQHGSDAAAIEMRARRHDGGWVLSGEKTSITFGMSAATGLVLARTGGDGARGITAFYVDLRDAAVTRSPFRDMGGVAIGRASLHFDELLVPDDRVVGDVGGGFTQVMHGFEFARAVIALICIGAASASIDEALQHARDRTAFGQPIGRFQGVAFTLVEHSTKLAAARLLALRALELKDRGLDHAVESNMAKWWAPRVAVEAAHDALLTFGHSAYSDEYPLGQRIRDIIGLELGDGTANITKLVVAR